MDIDLRKNPYRGILTQIAGERKTTQGAVTTGFKNKNYSIIKRINELVAERDAEIAKFTGFTKNT